MLVTSSLKNNDKIDKLLHSNTHLFLLFFSTLIGKNIVTTINCSDDDNVLVNNGTSSSFSFSSSIVSTTNSLVPSLSR